MYSDNIKFGEQPDDIYDHVEQLEGDIQWYREEIESLKKTNEYLEKSFNIQKNTECKSWFCPKNKMALSNGKIWLRQTRFKEPVKTS